MDDAAMTVVASTVMAAAHRRPTTSMIRQDRSLLVQEGADR
jgi:hypothetical protein